MHATCTHALNSAAWVADAKWAARNAARRAGGAAAVRAAHAEYLAELDEQERRMRALPRKEREAAATARDAERAAEIERHERRMMAEV